MKKLYKKLPLLFSVGILFVSLILTGFLMSRFDYGQYANAGRLTSAGSFTQVTLGNPTAGIGTSDQGTSLEEIKLIIETIARWLIITAVVIAIVFILYGGVLWITSGSDEDRQKKAKAVLKNGIIGALVVLAIGVIMNTLAGVVTRSFFGT